MALLNSKNHYIKLNSAGHYEVYISEESRKRVKESTASDTILAKYLELITNLEQDKEFQYYVRESFAAKYDPLVREYNRYRYNLASCIVGQEYPIMAEIYPDVANSIPEIVEAGCVPQHAKDIEEAYLKAKQLKQFGETTDV